METIDINSLTVRGIVQKTKDESANGVFTLIQPLVKCIEQTKDSRRREESLDILTDIFKKYALLSQRQAGMFNKESLMKTIFAQLSTGATMNLRKQSCNCIGAFAAVLNAT